MTLPMILILAAAAGSLWLGRWNATCWALALAYFVVEAWTWIEAPVPLDAGDYFMVDIITILLVTCKTIARHPETDPIEGWEHWRRFLAAPTFCDRLILGLFILAVWPAYIMNLSAFTQWFLLWGAAMAQFVIAGGEAINRYLLHRRSAKASSKDPDLPSSGPLKIAWARVEPWQT